MTDEQIDIERLAGEITLVLKHGTPEEKSSILRLIAQISGQDRADEIAKDYNL